MKFGFNLPSGFSEKKNVLILKSERPWLKVTLTFDTNVVSFAHLIDRMIQF